MSGPDWLVGLLLARYEELTRRLAVPQLLLPRPAQASRRGTSPIGRGSYPDPKARTQVDQIYESLLGASNE